MRLSLILLLCALAGILGGGALIGLPALGACLIFDSLAVGVFAWFRDDGAAAPQALHQLPTLAEILERARAS